MQLDEVAECTDEQSPSLIDEEEEEPQSLELSSSREAEGVTKSVMASIHRRFEPTEGDIEAAIALYLGNWLGMIFGERYAPYILDSRLCALHTRHLAKLGEVKELMLCSDEVLKCFKEHHHELGARSNNELPDSPVLYGTYCQFLKDHWSSVKLEPCTFRSSQIPAVQAVAEGRHVLVRLPTGEGKSVIFQVPALVNAAITGRLTLVVAPLRALMKDQVAGLHKRNLGIVSVDYLSGDRDSWENAQVYQHILDGSIEVLFVAPERFRVSRFRDVIARRVAIDNGLGFAVVDEAHCISQWGYEFRPDYLYAISEIRKSFLHKNSPTQLILLSATVTKQTQKNIFESAGFTDNNEGNSITTCPSGYSFPIKDHLEINPIQIDHALFGQEWQANISLRLGNLVETILKCDPEISTVLIFVARRKMSEEVRDQLEKEDAIKHFKIEAFHAGLPTTERQYIYESLDPEKKRTNEDPRTNVLVATKAFGMGMDIPNIHHAVHLSPPTYLEDYLQEIGRCGRKDEYREKASINKIDCHLLWSVHDFEKNHEQVLRSQITAVALVKLWDEIVRRQIIADDGSRLCILPTDAPELKNVISPTELSKALSWFENKPVSRIEIIGSLPDMLQVGLSHERLEDAASADSEKGLVAKALLTVFNQRLDSNIGPTAIVFKSQEAVESATQNKPNQEPASGGFLGLIKRFVGFFSKTPPRIRPIQEDVDAAPAYIVAANTSESVQINLGEVFRRSHLTSTEALWRALWQLIQDNAITIDRELIFQKAQNGDHRKTVLGFLDKAVRALIRETDVKRQINLDELSESLFPEGLAIPAGQLPANTNEGKLSKQVCWAAVHIVRKMGIRISEETDVKTGKRKLTFNIPSRKKSLLNVSLASTLEIMGKCSDKIEAAVAHERIQNAKKVTLKDLLCSIGDSGKISNLKCAINLLAELNIWKTEQELIPLSYLLRLLTQEALEVTTPDTSEGTREKTEQMRKDEEMLSKLWEINEFSLLRSFSMELFCLLGDSEIRGRFITAYFEDAVDSVALRKVMEQFIGDVGDGASGNLKAILEKARGEAFTEAFEGKEGKGGLSDEQKAVVQAPFNKNMLVNAGPGAGKTHVLMMRAAHLIHKQQIHPEQILILAFNRAVVHEIRARIKLMFTRLGYGNYVRRLRVRTFHSLALQYMNDDVVTPFDNDLNSILHNFSEKMSSDATFAHTVVGNSRAILVDEFQDMTADFYEVVKSLGNTAIQSNGAGIMVIGDDDQDIMQWSRRKMNEPVLDGSQYFSRFCTDFQDAVPYYLTNNYRSLPEIVNLSQGLINYEQLEIPRKKKDIILCASRRGDGAVLSKNKDQCTFNDIFAFIDNAKDVNKSCAILCRTNDQTITLFEGLRGRYPEIVIQGAESLRLGALRHVATFTDLVMNHLSIKGNVLLSDMLFEELMIEFKHKSIPEANDSVAESDLRTIWKHAQSEQTSARLKDLCGFIDEIRTEDFARIKAKITSLETFGSQFSVVISTINKVKGLQFDCVWVHPSDARFPFDGRNNDPASLHIAAIEEAKLYYVAMTRAKDMVCCGWGERENAWYFEMTQFTPVAHFFDSVMFLGSLDEVVISFPAFNLQRQTFVESELRVGDSIEMKALSANAFGLINRGQIAKLSTAYRDRLTQLFTNADRVIATLRVVAIYRYNYQPAPVGVVDYVCEVCRNKGWFYTVLIAGTVEDQPIV